MKTLGKGCGFAACIAVLLLGGCGGDSGDLRSRVKQLEEENKALKAEVERLSEELRPLRTRTDRLEQEQDRLEKTLANARKELDSRVTEMVQQEMQGGRRGPRMFPQPPPPARFEERPYMGFDGQDIEPDVAKLLNLKAKSGVLVTDVREGSPAAIAGIVKNDVVIALDKDEIKTFQDLKRALAAKKVNDVVTITVQRGDEKMDLKVTLGARRVRVDE